MFKSGKTDTNFSYSSLAKQVYTEQIKHGWPGLVTECQELLKQWNLKDIFERSTKSQWKNSVKKESKIQNENKLRKLVEKSSKLEIIKGETYGGNPT